MADLTFKEDEAPIRGHRAKIPIYDDYMIDREIINKVLNKFIKGEKDVNGN